MHSSKLKVRFNVRRNGHPIRKYWLRPGLKVGITYGRSFTEAQACMKAGLDYYMWRTDEYPMWFKAEVVGWYELNGLIDAHVRSVEEKAMKSRKKGKGKKG